MESTSTGGNGAVTSSIIIKKRNRSDEAVNQRDHVGTDNDNAVDVNHARSEELDDNNDNESQHLIRKIHHEDETLAFTDKAREELNTFLRKKGIDPSLAKNIKILAKRTKPRKNGETGYSVQYVDAQNSIYASKSDVYLALAQKPIDEVSPTAAFRQELFKEAAEKLFTVADDLPHVFDGIKVFNFGRIVPSELFYNTIKVYPVGYKCEMEIDTSHSRRYSDDTHVLLCEIFGFDDEPEFVITVKSSGKVFIAATEAEAWKKVETDFSYQGSPLSFFNLDVELLIEGLPGILDCSEYIFHRERGYGDVYSTNEEALAMTTSFLNKRNRAARNRQRQEVKVLSADERKAAAEEKKKRKELEDGQRREKAAAEKERRESERAAAQERKSREKERSKRSKEEIRREERQRQQLRKDIHSDLRRARNEAHAAVLQYFDIEEETFEQEQHVRAAFLNDVTSGDSLEVVLNNIQKEEDHDVVQHGGFQDALELTSALYVFRQLLQLRLVYVNEQFLLKDDIVSTDETVASEDITKDAVEHESKPHVEVENEPEGDTNAETAMDVAQQPPVTDKEITIEDSTVEQSDMEIVASTGKDVAESKTDTVAEPAEEPDDPIKEKIIHPLTEVDFDVIQLNLIRCMVSDLHSIMNLTEKDPDPKSRRAANSLIPLPLNQLTWHELARMLIIVSICKELDRSEDDALCAIKGSKNAIFRSNKNIIRNLRYRMVHREYNENRVAPVKDMWCKYTPTSSFVSMDSDTDVDLSSESSLIAAVTDASNSEEYSEVYRRCAKVWLRVSNMSQAKYLMWEVDSIEYPEYYEAIKHPMMLCNVALKLLQKGYTGEEDVAMAFYSDMRQILVNCFVYYTEFTLIHGQAQRIMHALYRHMCRWVWVDEKPPLEACDDQHCLLTGVPIVQQSGEYTSLKCGRCNGVFSLTELQDYSHSNFVIQPSEEQVMQLHEEWICLYCLQDDTLNSESVNSRGDFYMDEWGPSALVPWFLDEKELVRSENPVITTLYNALQILTTVYLTPIPNVLNLKQSLAYVTWSMSERVTVMKALCEVLKSHNTGYAYLSQRYNECVKLSRLSLKEPFCEGEFIDQVKVIAGDEGLLASRSLMDGCAGNTEQDLQYRVIEGRCIICKGSTFEDDCPGEAVLLCDGCNAEVHLDCVQLEKVPKGSWYCEPCQRRIDTRENAGDNDFTSIDMYRSSDLESALVDEALTARQRNMSESDLLVCEYCGQNEYDTCSPMVYGQSRYEFDFYAGQCSVKAVDNIIPGKTRTSLRFNLLQEDVPEPSLTVPYFPRVTTSSAKKRFQGTSCPVVHELCALYMFQSRVQRARHAIRRKRRLVAERITQMSGIATKPLGQDARGRLYWTFPQEESLYVSPLEKNGRWIKITDSVNIIKLIDSLNNTNHHEENLQKNLSLYYQYLTAKNRQMSSEHQLTQVELEQEKDESESGSQTSSAPVVKSQRLSEGKPTQLRLNTDKGYDLHKQYVIKQENIFEDRDLADDDDDEEEATYQDFFNFSKGSRYYALGLFDCYDKIVKLPKTSRVTVTFQIHKDGQMLAYTPLSEQWGDGYYYFSTLSFKRSGKYTISFIVEGITAVNIPPVVYAVEVITERYNCGISSAHGRLNAYHYMGLGDRHVSSRRRDLFTEVHHAADEIQAVRSALIAVYLALPNGALVCAPDSEERGEVVMNVAEATGWNSSLDQIWRAAVLAAQTPLALMECVLILEYYIAKQWLSNPHMRLFSALPNAHFALRCVTCASVALRVYCLDRCVLYDKVQALPRGTRLAEVRSRSDIPRPPVSSSRRSRGAREVDSESEDESRSSRPRRTAMARAQAQLRSQFDSEDDSEVTSSRSLRVRAPKPVGPVNWECEVCGVENEARARSCGTCGERKPAASSGKLTRAERRRRDDSDESSNEDDAPSKRRKVSSDSEDGLELSDSEEVLKPLDFNALMAEKEEHSLIWRQLQVLSHLQQDERSLVFWESVEEDDYPDYRDFIDEPMDLRTVAERVNVGYYGDDVQEFVRCVNLVWGNCQKYNQEGSAIYVYSQGLSVKFNELVQQYDLVPRKENTDPESHTMQSQEQEAFTAPEAPPASPMDTHAMDCGTEERELPHAAAMEANEGDAFVQY